MNVFKRLGGIFVNPKPVFQSLGEKPVWADALIIVLLAVIVFSVFATPYSRQDQLSIYENSTKMKAALGEARFDQTIAALRKPLDAGAYISAGGMSAIMMLLAILIQCLFLMIMTRLFAVRGTYAQILSIFAHACFIDKLLGNGVRMLLVTARKSVMQTSTGLTLLFPKLEVTSTAYVILGQVDFFQLWTFGLIGLGLSTVLKIDIKKAMFISYGFWLLKCLANIPMGLLSLSFMR